MKVFGKSSIGRKITLCVAIIIIAAMGITGGATYLTISKNMQSTVRSNMLSSVQDKANLLSTQIGCYKKFVKSAADSDAVRSLNSERQKDELKNDMTKYGFINMGYSDSSGNVEFVDGTSEALAYQTFYINAQNNQVVTVSDPFVDDNLKKMVIMIAAPVKDSSDTGVGIVVGVIDASFVTSLTKDITVGETGYCFVLNETGHYVASKDKKKVDSGVDVFTEAKTNSTLKGFKSIATDIVGGKTDYSEYSEKGSEQCIVYAPIKEANWFLALKAPKSELFESANNMLKQVVFFTILFIVIAIICLFAISRSLITRPLKRTVKMLNEMSLGHLDMRLKVKSNDEIGQMSQAMNTLADTLENDIVGTLKSISSGDMSIKVKAKDSADQITPELINTINKVNDITMQTERIIAAAKEGVLTERCDAEGYEGSWRDLANDINGLMDSVAAPINEVRSVVRRMAVNDYTAIASGNYNGLFKELVDDVNNVRERLLNLQDVMVRVSKGDMSRLAEYKEIGVLSDADSLTPAVVTMMTTIENLAYEVKNLAYESINGNLYGARGNADKFEGEYHEIVKGFNDTLDAVSRPLSEVQRVLGAMAVNDFTQSLSDGYKGDYLSMAHSVGMVRENLISMQNLAVKISLGDISELDKYRTMGKQSENDMLIPAFTDMMESIKKLIGEVTSIAESAAAGKLDVRGDPEQFNGEYVGIVNSINELLDAVAKPIGEVTRVMTSISNASFDVRIDGNYNGEFATLVSAVNKTASDLKIAVGEISEIMLRVSQGDLAIDHIDSYNGDFKAISEAINQITTSLNEVLGSINSAAEEVDESARGVSSVSQELSEGTEVQASSIEQLNSSISQISAKTKQNAENSAKASSIAEQTKEEALSGNKRMEEMLQSIEEISIASHDISKIVNVINEIAFQTKILSLNASVEAAHAGVYGKSFAVVAAEVGNLAHKSSQAAQETTALIEDTIKKVQSGTQVANETAQALGRIVNHVDNVAQIIGGIAESSSEQAIEISQINAGIQQVSNVVQNNSITMQQSAAASEELSGQSEQLKNMIGRFKLRKHE
jgi:methyl-accepting chemotaxis protein